MRQYIFFYLGFFLEIFSSQMGVSFIWRLPPATIFFFFFVHIIFLDIFSSQKWWVGWDDTMLKCSAWTFVSKITNHLRKLVFLYILTWDIWANNDNDKHTNPLNVQEPKKTKNIKAWTHSLFLEYITVMIGWFIDIATNIEVAIFFFKKKLLYP